MKTLSKIALAASISLFSVSGFSETQYKMLFQADFNIQIKSTYDFDSHTFTNCGQSGRSGPSLNNCLSSYQAEWVEDSEQFSVNSGIQEWTVPTTGQYRVIAAGAEGGGQRGGNGAIMSGTFTFKAGEIVQILVGQQGVPTNSYNGQDKNNASGGGGSFVASQDNNPLIIAGGGGAAYGYGSSIKKHANTGESGSSSTGNSNSHSGGKDGYGGGGFGDNLYEGGAGFYGNGSDRARSFVNGGRGGKSYNSGGFGGGVRMVRGLVVQG